MRISKLIAAVVGVVMVAGSVAMVAVGTFMVAATDDVDGFISAGPVRVHTDTAALVGDEIEIFFDEPVRGGSFLGVDDIATRLSVVTRNDKDLFLGIGPADEVSRYLAGGSHSVVSDFGENVILDSYNGSSDLEMPGIQDFWAASTLDDVLNWNLESGRWSVVLMNQDGSAGVDSWVTAAGRVPFLRPIGAAVLVIGFIGLIIGIALTYFGIKNGPETTTITTVPPQSEPVPTA